MSKFWRVVVGTVSCPMCLAGWVLSRQSCQEWTIFSRSIFVAIVSTAAAPELFHWQCHPTSTTTTTNRKEKQKNLYIPQNDFFATRTPKEKNKISTGKKFLTFVHFSLTSEAEKWEKQVTNCRRKSHTQSKISHARFLCNILVLSPVNVLIATCESTSKKSRS